MEKTKHQFQSGRSLIVILIVLLAIVWAENTFAISKKKLRRVDKQGPVKITATYQNPLEKDLKNIVFDLKLDTHSVNLDQYKLDKLSFVTINSGALQPALSWKPTGSSHHYTGTLEFAGPAPSDIKSLQLVIRGVGDVEERVLEWQLPIR